MFFAHRIYSKTINFSQIVANHINHNKLSAKNFYCLDKRMPRRSRSPSVPRKIGNHSSEEIMSGLNLIRTGANKDVQKELMDRRRSLIYKYIYRKRKQRREALKAMRERLEIKRLKRIEKIRDKLVSTSRVMSKSALVILAQGAEEMETVITVDMLRRGGVTVTMAGLDSKEPVLCSRQVTLVPDKSLADALAEKPEYDAVILPGGLEGSERLSKSSVVGTLLKEHEKNGKIIAAICAAPTAFVAHSVAQGKRVTSYPSTKEKIVGDYKYVEGERVVVDGNVVTSRGPGTAYWFGLTLIEMLTGKEKAQQVEKGMIITGY